MSSGKTVLWIVAGILALTVVALTGDRLFNRGDVSNSQAEDNTLLVIEPTTKQNSTSEVAKNQSVKVFFNNNKFDPGLLDCSSVYFVNRSIKPTLAVGRAALEELFKGLTPGEGDLGYITNIPAGVKIQKLTIENWIAKVDLSKELQQGVGGSCHVTAIQSQITETLKQFPTVQEVIISIDGETENILQP